jgi:putative Holliday junction resolvase
MRTLGIDFGERRIGLAISDPEGRIATPWTALERTSDVAAIARIVELARSEQVARFVVGEPRGLEGNRGKAAERAQRFAARLAATAGLPYVLVDEALTTVEAARRLREAGLDPRRHRHRLDAVAAQILLQEQLDRERSVAE